MVREKLVVDYGKENIPSFVPDYIAANVFDVDFEHLHNQGIRNLLFDLDATLRPLGSPVPEDSVTKHLQEQVYPIIGSVALATGNPRTAETSLMQLGLAADKAVLPYDVNGSHITKPNPQFFQRALSVVGGEPANTAMIGDKLFWDINGANRVGLTTVWMSKPLGRDRYFDAVTIRPAEKIALLAAHFVVPKIRNR